MNQVLAPLVIVAALAPAAAGGASLRLCLEDRAEVSVAARGELLREIIRLFPSAEFINPADCERNADAVRIFLAKGVPGRPPDALGAVKVEADGRLSPPALVFVDAVAEYSRANDELTLGRALARVAGHELLHYLRQSSDHDAHGPMRERLTAQDLTERRGGPAWTRLGR